MEVDKKMARCFHCRKKVEVKDPRVFVGPGKGGQRLWLKGFCPDCGGKLAKIVGGVPKNE